jgi:PadR family transcriptional regulator, regulatory protein PadR
MPNRESLGEFEQLVLLAVARLGEAAYGVSICHEIKAQAGRNVSRGAVYITLDRLEHRGYIRTWLADPTPERGGKSKRLCAMEPTGAQVLIESRETLERMWRGLDPALGGL